MKKVDFKVILIHGNGGSTVDDNWFPYAKKKLSEMNINVISRTFPDNKLARSKYWLPFLKNILKADEKTIIVGHSSGAVAAMRFAEENKIFGSILISASYTDLGDEDEIKSGYFKNPWKWKLIKKNQNWIVQFASIDDPYIPITEARYIHTRLKTDYREYKNRGHFGWDKQAKEFPELIKIIEEKLNLETKEQ